MTINVITMSRFIRTAQPLFPAYISHTANGLPYFPQTLKAGFLATLCIWQLQHRPMHTTPSCPGQQQQVLFLSIWKQELAQASEHTLRCQWEPSMLALKGKCWLFLVWERLGKEKLVLSFRHKHMSCCYMSHTLLDETLAEAGSMK